ncbi:TetR family transcriptional regulator [Bacillaceae bacterium SIJ1]|nr:TetR family transcriptional regulator [Litoribacterium kuwaitense]NGP46804.1 TetR family transcriptional regulator [Litoribacterium kuwaitense]
MMTPRVGLDHERLVSEALKLLNDEGETGLSMAALARRLGVRPASLYNHVDSLGALRKQLAIYSHHALKAFLKRESAGLEGDEAIRAMANAFATFAHTSPGQFLLFQCLLKSTIRTCKGSPRKQWSFFRSSWQCIGLVLTWRFISFGGFAVLFTAFCI